MAEQTVPAIKGSIMVEGIEYYTAGFIEHVTNAGLAKLYWCGDIWMAKRDKGVYFMNTQQMLDSYNTGGFANNEWLDSISQEPFKDFHYYHAKNPKNNVDQHLKNNIK